MKQAKQNTKEENHKKKQSITIEACQFPAACNGIPHPFVSRDNVIFVLNSFSCVNCIRYYTTLNEENLLVAGQRRTFFFLVFIVVCRNV